MRAPSIQCAAVMAYLFFICCFSDIILVNVHCSNTVDSNPTSQHPGPRVNFEFGLVAVQRLPCGGSELPLCVCVCVCARARMHGVLDEGVSLTASAPGIASGSTAAQTRVELDYLEHID